MRIFFIVILLFIAGCSSSSEVDVTSEEEVEYNTTIVAMGDSLTEGLGVPRNESYPAILESRLEGVRVHNSGLSGETSSGAINRIEWVMRLEPDIVIVVTGANDAMRGIELDNTRENIENIISYFISRDVEVILGGLEMYENLGPEYVQEFETMYDEIARENDVYYIESFLGRVGGNDSLNQDDRIHPTYEGYQIIVEENVLPVVKEVLSQE